MDTRIDFKTAKKFDQLELVDWKTRYADFKFYVRKGLHEVQYNVGPCVTKSPNSGEYIRYWRSHWTLFNPNGKTVSSNQKDLVL